MRVVSVVVMMFLCGVGVAIADTPDKVFAGTIVASLKSFPSGADVAAIKKQAAVNFQEDKKEHTWTVFLVGYFKAPLDDVEYVLKVHDLSNKTQVLLSLDKYVSARGLKMASTKVVLDKEKVGVNKELLITMESKGKVLATTRLRILGDYEQHSGKVDFSDGNDDD
jgi:hypothetical protein